MKETLRASVVMVVLLTLLTGLAYPLCVTVLAQVCFPTQANGSLVLRNGHPVGSTLIGQPFYGSRYFQGRPSATATVPYDAAASGGSNLGPLNPALRENVQRRIEEIRRENPGLRSIPADLVTASGSGLDPHITPASAMAQVARVVKARGMSENDLRAVVARHTEGRQFGLLGEPRVNILLLNLALDEVSNRP